MFMVLLPFLVTAQQKKTVTKCTDLKLFLRSHTQKMTEKGCYLLVKEEDMQRKGLEHSPISPFEKEFIPLANKCLKGMTTQQVIKYLGQPSESIDKKEYIYYYKGKFDGKYYQYTTTVRIPKVIKVVKKVTSGGTSGDPRIEILIM